MKAIGVITGDIVKSSEVKAEWRDLLLETIRETALELEKFSALKLELFRGDSFQVAVDKPEEALNVAVLLRAGLQAKTPKESHFKWDARVSLGVGSTGYNSDSIVVSDGEAFHLSGREFDELGKRRLSVRTPWPDVNDEMKVSTSFADEIITEWSIPQAQAIYLFLLNRTSQKQLATELNKSAQNISKLLNTGKESLISLYINRFRQIIQNKY